jgi:predicted phosphodiesterase
MKRILMTGDLQFSSDPRDNYRLDLIPWLAKTMKAESIERLIVLGDLTEAKDHHGAAFVNYMATAFKLLGELAEVVIVQGNHDAVDIFEPFFHFLRFLPRVSWIKSPIYDGGLLYLPYTSDYLIDWKDVEFKDVDFLFTHNTFHGADLGNGITADKGIPPDAIPKHVRVFSGDVHRPQTIGKVTYVGSPYTVDFGDDYEGRVIIFGEDGRYTQSLPYVGRQKRLIKVASLKDLQAVKNVHQGDILKIQVKLTPDLVPKFSKIKDTIRAWGEKEGCVVHLVQPITDAPDRQAKDDRASRSARSDGDIMKDYAAERATPKDTLAKGMEFVDRKGKAK